MQGPLGGNETAPRLSPAGQPWGLAQVRTGNLGRGEIAKYVLSILTSELIGVTLAVWADCPSHREAGVPGENAPRGLRSTPLLPPLLGVGRDHHLKVTSARKEVFAPQPCLGCISYL